jgi:hypothetical protein
MRAIANAAKKPMRTARHQRLLNLIISQSVPKAMKLTTMLSASLLENVKN